MRQLMGINGETFLVLEHETREMCFAVTAKVFGEKMVSLCLCTRRKKEDCNAVCASQSSWSLFMSSKPEAVLMRGSNFSQPIWL